MSTFTQSRIEYDEGHMFDLNHNLAEYEQLVENKYVGSDVLEEYAPRGSNRSSRGAQALDDYLVSSNAKNRIDDFSSRASFAVDLDTYEKPTRNASHLFPSEQFRRPSETYSAPAPELTSYQKPTATGRSTSFHEELFDTSLDEVDYAALSKPKEMEKRAAEIVIDVNLANERAEAKETFYEKHEKTENPKDNAEYITSYKLNNVGMVAVVSFIAVTLLVIAFIIMNSVNIVGNSMAINNLAAQNSALSMQISTATGANAAAAEGNLVAEFAKYGIIIESANSVTAEQAAQYAIKKDYVMATVNPPIVTEAWTAQTNPDASSNFFDKVSKFLSKLFI
jgi:hypothetical protein